MINDAAVIERIVRQVLAERGLMPRNSAEPGAADGGAGATSARKSTPAASPQPAAREGDLVVTRRVVTLADVAERLPTARRLIVPPRAIVTPAVRDELRRRKVGLVFEEHGPSRAPASGDVLVAVLGSRIDPAPVLEELALLEIGARTERYDCLIKATDAAARHLAGARSTCVILSNHGAVALCLANRHARVRAVLGREETQAAADTASVGANLLVVEPRDTPPPLLRRLVADFTRHGPLECPETLAERLG